MSTLALPLRIGVDGSLASVEVDSARAIAQSVAVVAITPLGDRRAVPLFGSIDQLFSRVGSVFLDRAAVTRWEERATPERLQVLTYASDGVITTDGISA